MPPLIIICKGRGRRSCSNEAIEGSEFCRFHNYEVCQGVTKDGRPCGSKKRINSPYCRDSHDPGLEYTDPKVLRSDGLRYRMMETVREFRDFKDPYLNTRLPDDLNPEIELDHVTENHIYTGCIDRIRMDKKEKENLLEHLRDNCVNERENLAFTAKETNQLKFKAFDSYFRDYKEGKISSEGLFKYLQDEGRLPRRISHNINREVVRSYDFVMNRLESERHEAMMEELHDCFVIGMKLK